MRRSTRPLFTRGLLATGGGVALLASLLVPSSQASVPGETAPLPAAVAAAEATPTVSPVAQTGPRNIIKRLSDTYIKSTDTADHSQERLLHVGSPDNGATKYRSFMRFDVSKLRGAPIKSATLRVYNSFVSDCAAKAWMGVYPVTETWDQSTITWANQPAVGAGKDTAFGLGHPNCPDVPNKTNPEASNGITRIDVTDWVKGWAATTLPNHGIMFRAQEDGSSGYKDFCSMNPVSTDYACHAAYNAPTLEVEFNEGHTPVISGNVHGPAYPDNYPTAHAALEFFDSTNPAVWPASGPYQRWIPDAYHSVFDTTLKGDTWEGGTSHKLRPGGVYGGNVLVTGDGASGFIGVIPYPSLAGYHWAINVGDPGDLHGVEMLPDGTVVAAFASRVFGQDTTGKDINGGLLVFSKAQGTPGSWNATPVQDTSLAGAHEVLYDPATNVLWAVGDELLVRYKYANGRLSWDKGFPLPKQAGDNKAYGHELAPVYGNPDRLWIGSNGGITQFSKSEAVDCYANTDEVLKNRWPLATYVTGFENRWCTDYPNAGEVTNRTLIKSVGNDPVTGAVASTCSQGCPETQTSNYVWETHSIRFVPTSGAQSIAQADPADRRYKATWAVPAYQ
ncbi:DNRLRE domain-containing protein [Streptomyces sp. SKN60]|uniref:DNRLRE domain-containing protein n=1 Tax=Streptomyces sp. SKN60 TaxID=2855506 RepID=UPI0022455BCC|nr:DNRLRE domain-containing protein [Streptomyces sp. SKN60]MCX2185142.1 DNRLRE domain-containing protein [Streptomyces sp. SKN60]